jgi:hypothetical protein
MLGVGPSELHPTDPDARIMGEGGYWITDFHALFTDGATFRPGRWKELTTRVHRLGELASASFPLSVCEHGTKPGAESRTKRTLPAGIHGVFVAGEGSANGELPLALLIRFGSAPVVGWAPALFERQPMPQPPLLPVLRPRASPLIVAAGDPVVDLASNALQHGACMVGKQAIALNIDGGKELQSFWGLDSDGELAAFVLDASGALLREFERRQPTPSDRRSVNNSCPRIAKDEASLVRRLEKMIAKGWIELLPDAAAGDVAKAFFAQPKGNLRAWLSDQAPNIAEIYYSD